LGIKWVGWEQGMDMVSAGYFHNFNKNAIEASVEVYYKKMSHLIDFADHAQLMLNKKLDGEIRVGNGKAYGVELMVRKNTGALTGFINYTLSHCLLQAEFQFIGFGLSSLYKKKRIF
jgi:outer membrane cobalamin receptor